MSTPAEILAAVKKHIADAYRDVGTAAFAPRRFEIEGITDAETATVALFRLAEEGFLTEKARLTCPNGHSWESKGAAGPRIKCPVCRETFPADDINARVVFKLTQTAAQVVKATADDGGKGDANSEGDTPGDLRRAEVTTRNEGVVLAGTAAEVERFRQQALAMFGNSKVTIEPRTQPSTLDRAGGAVTWFGDHMVKVVLALIALAVAAVTALGAMFAIDPEKLDHLIQTIPNLLGQ